MTLMSLSDVKYCSINIRNHKDDILLENDHRQNWLENLFYLLVFSPFYTVQST